MFRKVGESVSESQTAMLKCGPASEIVQRTDSFDQGKSSPTMTKPQIRLMP
jgi:hypothetical protein